MFKLEVQWIAGMVCMHGKKPLNGALGCRSVGHKVCIPNIAGLECRFGVKKFPGCIRYVVLQIRLLMEEISTSSLHMVGPVVKWVGMVNIHCLSS